MTIGLRQGRLMAAMCAMAALSACGEPTTVTGPSPRLAPLDPRVTLLDPGAPGVVVICSSGGPASFKVTASPAIGTLLGGGRFTLADGACANAWTAAPNNATNVSISVTEIAGAFISIEATAVPPTGLPYMTVTQETRTVSWYTNFAHGGSATFFQAAPKKVVLCKEGPVGTYSFTVDAVGGEGNVYPSGSSFTIAAGECKDVWTTDAPPHIDPFVTLTELGTTPLDSIRKVPQDSGAVIVTGSRSVVSQVSYFHGSVVTYFNAFPPPPPPTCQDQAATNYGGPLPCAYTTPSATCVAITATQGVAIVPVTLVGTGGSGGPYTFSATGLPAGLTMSASGTISGTPTVSGTFTYTVTITDSGGRVGTFDCSVVVYSLPSASCVAITATQGVAIVPVTLVGTGGSGGPYTFSATGLPAGLTMSASGTISGTPTVSGTFTYTVTITDSGGRVGTFNCSVTVTRPTGIQGCTPGYWKAKPHADTWPATGYEQTQLIGSVFAVPSSYVLTNIPMGNYTLLGGLNFQGGTTLSGKAEILLRAAIAGVLNAGHMNVAYGMTAAQLISSVNTALASANATTIIDLATQLDNLNNGRGGCPLN